jgi:hypothetical protein
MRGGRGSVCCWSWRWRGRLLGGSFRGRGFWRGRGGRIVCSLLEGISILEEEGDGRSGKERSTVEH